MLVDLNGVTVSHEKTPVLEQVDFHAEEGEFIYLIGKVGTGKSSLLKTIYGELPVKTGQAVVLDYDLCKLKRKRLPDFRREIGIVFQDFQLLDDRTVYDNLDFVLKATEWKKKNRPARIAEVLQMVGMSGKENSFPHELSGGEQQRIAIARALLNSPQLILADEPTGNLDEESGRSIVAILRDVCDKGATVIMSTHNKALLQKNPGVVYECADGKLRECPNQPDTAIQP